jgi:hypothetical protein
VERGPDQGKGADFKGNRQYERCFTGSWFTKQLSNGNSVDRDWMMYRKTNHRLAFRAFCSENRQMHCQKKKLYSDWKNLHPRTADHEDLVDHGTHIFEVEVNGKTNERRTLY